MTGLYRGAEIAGLLLNIYFTRLVNALKYLRRVLSPVEAELAKITGQLIWKKKKEKGTVSPWWHLRFSVHFLLVARWPALFRFFSDLSAFPISAQFRSIILEGKLEIQKIMKLCIVMYYAIFLLQEFPLWGEIDPWKCGYFRFSVIIYKIVRDREKNSDKNYLILLISTIIW